MVHIFTKLLVVIGLVAVATANASADDPKNAIELQVVKHARLLKEIAKLKGSVVLVDFWGTWCIPCKQGFPKVVAMHEKYHKDGLVCVSVHIIGVDRDNEKSAAATFLTKAGARFPNYFLDEEGPALDEVQNHWNMVGQPAYFVFDRTGKIAARFPSDNQVTYSADDIESAIKRSLPMQRQP